MWNIAKLLFIVLLTGCPLVSFEYLDIFCSVHEGEQYYSDQTVDLSFSIMPDRQETERMFILNEGGLGKTVDFSWSGKILHIKPLTGWKKGEYYSLSLDGSLTMEDGRMYTAGISRAFIYGKGDEFCLTGSSMEDRCLILNFSKAPKITSFNKQFILSPSTEYFCDFFGETVKIQPKNSWQINTLYTWSFTGMESLDGYIMKKEYSGFFLGDEDLQIPYPEKICPVILLEDPGGLSLEG
jgi:hypothetical protein